MFGKRKLRVQAEELAASLFDEFVQRQIGFDESLKIDKGVASPTRQKLHLYQFASVMLAVLNAERADTAFSPVRQGLERRYFPSTFSEGAEHLQDVKRAMKDLTDLIQPNGQPRPMTWAMRWLSDVGIQQDNPATLMMFALRWPSHFTTVAEALREFDPVA
jgi:hypothetical protein